MAGFELSTEGEAGNSMNLVQFKHPRENKIMGHELDEAAMSFAAHQLQEEVRELRELRKRASAVLAEKVTVTDDLARVLAAAAEDLPETLRAAAMELLRAEVMLLMKWMTVAEDLARELAAPAEDLDRLVSPKTSPPKTSPDAVSRLLAVASAVRAAAGASGPSSGPSPARSRG